MMAQYCQVCGKSLSQDFNYCSKICKKEAKAKRKEKKRDFEQKKPQEIEVWVEEISHLKAFQEEPSQKISTASYVVSKSSRRNLKALQHQKGALDEKQAALEHQQEVKHYEQNLLAQQKRAQTAKKRNFWTPAETKLLCNLVVKHGAQWAMICKQFDSRSNVNCKDRIRTIAAA